MYLPFLYSSKTFFCDSSSTRQSWSVSSPTNFSCFRISFHPCLWITSSSFSWVLLQHFLTEPVAFLLRRHLIHLQTHDLLFMQQHETLHSLLNLKGSFTTITSYSHTLFAKPRCSSSCRRFALLQKMLWVWLWLCFRKNSCFRELWSVYWIYQSHLLFLKFQHLLKLNQIPDISMK